MRNKTHRLLLLLPLVLIFGLANAPAQVAPAPAASLSLDQKLPFDPQVTRGTLPNGLTYFIRKNQKPENRAELRLVVNAGSVLENEEQRGLAHFVEHMAFNGTKHFEKQAIVSFMESIGMRFGPSLNAFTSFDETVYMLQIPTDKPEVMTTAFRILEDWAHNLSFDPAEIDKERGVIIEEWRMGRGAGARMQDQQLPVLLKGSRYAERLPIGKKEILESFDHEVLRQFYRDWYRPDLMAVIAVGDFDPAAVEALIKERFGSIPRPGEAPPRTLYEVPDHPETLYAIATDPEATMTSVSVYNKLPLRDPTTAGAYRQSIVEQLYVGMLNRRFSELAQKPDAPFLAAGAGQGLFVRSKEASMLNAMVKEDGIARGLEAIFTEANRVARFGFTSTELERQKRDLLRSVERAFTERDRQESSSLAAEYVRHFTQREPVPGIALEYDLHRRFVPEITLEEVHTLARSWNAEKSRVVMVNAPQKQGLKVPDSAALSAVIARATEKPLEPYVDTVVATSLLEKLPEPGSIVKRETREPYGVTEWQLSNGARVVLMPTTHKQDEVVVRATSPGGSSLASDADHIPAATAAQIVTLGGVGPFSAIELQKVLSGKVASVAPAIGQTEEGLMGYASPKDLETLFQLIFMRFTQPRPDPAIFGVMTTQMKAMLANQQASPDFAFSAALTGILTQNHPRAQPMTVKLVDEMSLDKSLAFYKDRFADASDFTFVFVGSFTLDAIEPFVARYLASLPATDRNETWKDLGIHPPKGIVERTVRKGTEPKSRSAIVFTGPFKWDAMNRLAMRAMELALQTRLREAIREDLSGTYGVQVSAGYSKIPEPEYSVSIGFGSSPERVDELTKAVFQEIESLKANGPTARQVDDVRQALFRNHETNMKQNSYLAVQMMMRYQHGEDLKGLFEPAELYNRLDARTIQEAARTYLDGNYVKVTLLPDKTAGGAR